MPPSSDQVQPERALQDEALPSIESPPANSDHLDGARRRFDNDDEPPAHASSSEDECEPAPNYAPPLLLDEPLPADVAAIVDAPLDEEDLRQIALKLPYLPGNRYFIEARAEADRLNRFRFGTRCTRQTQQWFEGGLEADARHKLLVRHNIRKRWQKLGVWNPKWGIPGRFGGDRRNDDRLFWRWAWDSDEPDEGVDRPAVQAALLRRGLRRGEFNPAPPHRSLTQGASASEGQSFITSRPWFTFVHDLVEEGKRFDNVPSEVMGNRRVSTRSQVVKRWKERGDWPADNRMPGEVGPALGYTLHHWKWRHESPSPEPDDPALLNNVDFTELDPMDLDLTPSEIDALEVIPKPSGEYDPFVEYDPLAPIGPPGPISGPALPASPPPPASPSGAGPAPSPPPPPPPPEPPARRRGRPPRSQDLHDTVVCYVQQPLRRSPRIAANLAALVLPAEDGAEHGHGAAQTGARGGAAESSRGRRATRPSTKLAGAGVSKRGRPRRR